MEAVYTDPRPSGPFYADTIPIESHNSGPNTRYIKLYLNDNWNNVAVVIYRMGGDIMINQNQKPDLRELESAVACLKAIKSQSTRRILASELACALASYSHMKTNLDDTGVIAVLTQYASGTLSDKEFTQVIEGWDHFEGWLKDLPTESGDTDYLSKAATIFTELKRLI